MLVIQARSYAYHNPGSSQKSLPFRKDASPFGFAREAGELGVLGMTVTTAVPWRRSLVKINISRAGSGQRSRGNSAEGWVGGVLAVALSWGPGRAIPTRGRGENPALQPAA